MATVPNPPDIELRPWPESGAITFYWRPPTSDGGSPVTKYTLASVAAAYTQDLDPSTPFYRVTGLTNGTDYTFTITATNAIGTSLPATFRTVQPGVIPFGPSTVVASTLNTSTALVTWNLSTIANEGASKWFLITVLPSTTGLSSYTKSAYIFERARTLQLPSTNIFYQFLVQSINDGGYCPPFAYTSSLGFGITDVIPTTGIYIWLDASTGNTIQYSAGSTVSTFSSRRNNIIFDRAPTNYTLPSVSSVTTTNINGLQTVSFRSSNAITQLSTLSSIRHFFWVGRQGTYLTENTLLGHSTLSDWRGSTITYTGPLTTSTIVFAPAVMYVNGASPRTANSSSNIPLAPLDRSFLLNINPLGEPTRFQGLAYNSNSGSTRGWNGNFGEMIAYSNALTAQEISSVNGYLINKWFPSPTSFSPSSIGSCLFWLDMSQPGAFTMSGSNVSTIRDFSSNANNLRQVPSGYANPVLGSSINTLSTIRVGSGRALTQPSTLNGVRHLFWVGRQLSNAGAGFLFGHDDLSIYDWHPANDNVSFIGTEFGSPSLTSATATIYNKNTDFRYQATFNGMSNPTSNSVFLLNVNPVSPFTTRFQGITYDRNISPRGWTGDLGEVICYNSTLTVQQQEQVEAYLKRKWAIFPEPVSSPTQLAGLQLWLDAADPYGNGTRPAQSTIISTFFDKSGLGRNAVAITNSNYYISSAISAKPSISLIPGAYFSGTISPNYTSNTLYVFSVFSGDTNTSIFGRLLSFGVNAQDDFGNSNFFGIIRNNGNNLGIYRNNIVINPEYIYRSPSSIPNGALITTIFDGTSNAQTRFNGITISSSAANATFVQNLNLSLYRIGRSTNFGDTASWSGFISEVIVYSSLTMNQVESVEAYLKQKWIV